MNTVEQLRKVYRVYVTHRRHYGNLWSTLPRCKSAISYNNVSLLTKREAEQLGVINRELCPNAGSTTVEIYNKSTNEKLAHGIASVDIRDNFNRKVGLAVALGRALADLSLNIEGENK